MYDIFYHLCANIFALVNQQHCACIAVTSYHGGSQAVGCWFCPKCSSAVSQRYSVEVLQCHSATVLKCHSVTVSQCHTLMISHSWSANPMQGGWENMKVIEMQRKCLKLKHSALIFVVICSYIQSGGQI